MKRKYLFAIALLAGSHLLAGQPSIPGSSPTIPKLTDVNSEILQLVIQDQWDRGNDMFGDKRPSGSEQINWKNVSERDAQRHAQVRKLISEGKLQSGRDYQYAALIFQHSEDPNDLMLAHVLAATAVSKGKADARWLAAATLDRYLHSLKQPQVFGTQFFKSPNSEWTMEPYNRDALSDSIRALWCVVPLSEQEQILKDYQQGKGGRPTGIQPCK
jgi:hypothetical protein